MTKKKEQLSTSKLKPSTKREKVTSFIVQKKSRQEFPPLVGKFIDRAKAEPLHLKNNAWQQWNLSVLKYALSRSDVSTCKSIVDIPPENCFGRYYNCLRFHVCLPRLLAKGVLRNI